MQFRLIRSFQLNPFSSVYPTQFAVRSLVISLSFDLKISRKRNQATKDFLDLANWQIRRASPFGRLKDGSHFPLRIMHRDSEVGFDRCRLEAEIEPPFDDPNQLGIERVQLGANPRKLSAKGIFIP